MVFHRSLSDSKFSQVFRTLLSILAVLNYVVWMVSTRLPTSKSSIPFSNPSVTVPNAPITIGIIVTCMFQSFFNSLARARYLSFFSHSFSFIVRSAGTAKSTIFQVLFFLLIIIRSGPLAEIRWSVWMSKSIKSLCVRFSKTVFGLRIYHLFVWSNLNCLHISKWITLPTQACLVLYSFCANHYYYLYYYYHNYCCCCCCCCSPCSSCCSWWNKFATKTIEFYVNTLFLILTYAGSDYNGRQGHMVQQISHMVRKCFPVKSSGSCRFNPNYR